MKTSTKGFADDLANWGRGMLMGGVDIIPGVSGGTIALLLGIYPRLLTAISRIDRDFLQHVIRGEWRAAAHHIDLRFLVALGLGVASGILLLAGVMHYLLTEHLQFTMATFFGLILGSAVIVIRMIEPERREQYAYCFGVGVVSAVGAAMLMLSGFAKPQEGLLYVFLCGMIAICAMILPGVSGAYVLIMLGKYKEITDILKRLKLGDVSSDDLLTLMVFAAGCAVGLIGFSKILRNLLSRFHAITMAVLGGFMIGSLVKIWPFQVSDPPGQVIDSHTKTLPVWPEVWDSHAWGCVGLAVLGCGLIVVLDQLANRQHQATSDGGSASVE